MKVAYDIDNNCKVYICSVCGHTHYYYYTDCDELITSAAKPFIKLEEPLLHTVSKSGEPDRIERVYQYACPICGVLQVDVKSI